MARRNGHVFVTGNSGFPKSHDISKALDREAGAEREETGGYMHGGSRSGGIKGEDKGQEWHSITAPATDAAKLWDGWGTALKPAWEPIIVAMKPLDGTFAQNALVWGVAGMWVDGGRVGTEIRYNAAAGNPTDHATVAFGAIPNPHNYQGQEVSGRWPANLILTIPEDEYIMREDLTQEEKREIFQWMQENT